MSVRIPKYRHHKPTNQALVEVNGRRFYLGKHGTEKSKEKYRRIVAELVTGNGVISSAESQNVLTVDHLILEFFEHCKVYYRKDDKPTDEIAAVRAVLKRLRSLYGRTPASDFGPKRFRVVRESLIAEGLSRKYINDSMARIRRMFKWASAQELIPASVPQALSMVDGLRKGRSKARESAPIVPVDDAIVEVTMRFLTPVIADMIRLQRLSGMRPAEVCQLRPCYIDRTGDVWLYRPASHKTQHHSKERVVFFGPQSQEILLGYLARAAEDYCFQLRDSEATRRAVQHAARKTPLNVGNRPGSNRKRKPKKQPRDQYSTDSYRRAIHYACDKAGVERWSPNRLRHSAATEVRRKFGLEAAQIVLGHSTADVTQVYAARDLAKGIEVAKKIG